MLTDVQFATVKEVFAKVTSIFEYVPDLELWNRLEHWEDPKPVEEQLTAGHIVGDCDSFVLACRYLLWVAKVPNRIAMCLAEGGEDHLVCEADGWILDNQQNRVRSWGELPYQWIKISGYKVGDPWHEVDA